MNEQQPREIKEFLQNKDVQERIQKKMLDARLKATVTISRAASIFGFSESQLREWEKKGLLRTERQALSQESRGHRQYTPKELDKLAIIKELIDAKFGPGAIPSNVDEIWSSIAGLNELPDQTLKPSEDKKEFSREADVMPIDRRIKHAYYKEFFWPYYASHALWLSLMLICEDLRFTRAGLILPLHTKDAYTLIHQPEDLPCVGESLVGWLGQSHSFYTFLTPAPEFEYASDFRILPLQEMEEEVSREEKPEDNTLLAVPRMETESRRLTLSKPIVMVIRRLLEPLYQEVPDWQVYLGQGMRDIHYPVFDFTSGTNYPEIILTYIAKRVVHLGGRTVDGQYRWRFCCVLMPNNPQLPLQQRSLVLRAKSKNAPLQYKEGMTIVSPEKAMISISLRAFQSGRIIYRHMVTPQDISIVNREWEESIGSAIAVPVGGEDGVPIAVLYIVSAQADAFSEEDQQLLRMVGRMVEELLVTYRTRVQVTEKFTNLIRNPSVVDPTFEIFASENEFIRDVEELLATIKMLVSGKEEGVSKENLTNPEIITEIAQSSEAVSFIAIDIDNQTSLTNKYGDRLTRNLSRVVGLRIQRQLRALFTNPSDCKLYHVYADRYYILLKGISLEQARTKAELLRQALNGSYQIDALRFSIEQPTLPENLLPIPDITVRLGVSSYPYVKLNEVLQRYPIATSEASTTALIVRDLNDTLKLGQDKGGNVIISWDAEIWGYKPWSQSN